MKNIRNTLMCVGLLLASVLGINSCQKPSVEGDVVRFSASTFSSPLTKTVYGNYNTGNTKQGIYWKDGDQITIACAQCSTPSTRKADYRVAEISSSGIDSEAKIIPVAGNGLTWGTGNHNFYAVYPGNNTSKITLETTGTVTATFQASQGYASTSTSGNMTTIAPDMSNAFMYASKQNVSVGSTVSLDFKPMFTALQFTVIGNSSSETTLTQVELSSTSCALSGRFDLNIGTNSYTYSQSLSGHEKITCTFPSSTKISSSKQICFTLFVPATKDATVHKISDLTIRFTLDGGATRALKLKNTSGTFYEFEGPKKYIIPTMTLPSTLETDFLFAPVSVVDPTSETSERVVGFFSVAPNIKVVFSPGNLQAYFATAGNSFTWRFAERQWDCVGAFAANTSINGKGTVSTAGTVDLFGWSNGTNYGIWNSTVLDNYPGGSLVDWGGAVGSGWRSLTCSESTYLLSTRGGPYRFCLATVHDRKGLVIFPDRYTHSLSRTFVHLNTSGNSSTCSSNNLSEVEWTTLEAAGCVFLPMAGVRQGSDVNSFGGAGQYWLAPSYGTSGSNSEGALFFNQMGVVDDGAHASEPRYYGCSVRLVKEI